MKVIFVHPNLGIGGAERLVIDVAIALHEKGHKVEFLTNHFTEKHAFEELKDNTFPIHIYGSWIPQNIFGKFHALLAYMKIVYLTLAYMILLYPKQKPEIFFVDQIPAANFILKLFRQKTVYYCHHPDLLASTRYGFFKRLYRMPIDFMEEFGCKLSDVILVNSSYTAKIVTETFPSLNKKLDIVYPSISRQFLSNLVQHDHIASEYDGITNGGKDDYIFLSINRFHPVKNIDLCIEAMDCLKSFVDAEKWRSIYLLIAGGYDQKSAINHYYYRKLKRLVHKKNLENNIIFLKSPNEEVKAHLYKTCNCVLYTPTHEHFGIVPLEAMAAGKPVIACNSGGPCETIEDNISGLLSKPDATSFAECMKQMLIKSNCEIMGQNGKKRLHEKFSFEEFKWQLNAIIDNS